MTATDTSTIAAWLLAQIEADEADNGCYGEGEYSTCWQRSERIEKTCAAHRAIAAEHEPFGSGAYCGQCRGAEVDEWDRALWPCPTLRALASIYADAPGYRAEWAL